MKITFMVLLASTAIAILSGCASPRLSPVTSAPSGPAIAYDSDFNSNDSMPSNR